MSDPSDYRGNQSRPIAGATWSNSQPDVTGLRLEACEDLVGRLRDTTINRCDNLNERLQKLEATPQVEERIASALERIATALEARKPEKPFPTEWCRTCLGRGTLVEATGRGRRTKCPACDGTGIQPKVSKA